MRKTVWLMAVLMVLTLPLTAAAQTGSVTGVVTDASGGALPGVTVTITGMGVTRSAVTDRTGRYNIGGLPPGSYEVSFELAAFARQTRTVAVAAEQPATLDTLLEIGGLAEAIEVTGTMIPRPTLGAMSPVTTLDPEEITYRGTARVEDLLTALPQVFAAQNASVSNGSSGTATVSLRYLGSDRTLVLIDGRRMSSGDAFATAPDLNFIPASLVRRVDVLTGGASSVYGADAVAGVVNFVLDKDFVGVRGGVQFAGYQHNNRNTLAREINAARGFTVKQGSVFNQAPSSFNVALGGNFAERKGHGTMYLDYRDTPAITKDARDYTNCSVQNLGRTGPACGGSATWQNGRFLVFSKDGRRSADWVLDVASAGGNQLRRRVATDVFNFAPYNFMQRPDTRWGGGGFLDYEWNRHARGYADVMFMDDYTDAQIAPSGDFGNTNRLNCDNPMLSAQQRQVLCTDMGYGPTDTATVIILRRNVEGGGRVAQLRHTALRFTFGVDGDINDSWRYDIHGLQAQVQSPQAYANDLNTDRIQDALIVDGDPNNPSTWRCRSGNTGCVPWNIFRTGGVTQGALDYLSLPLILDSGTRTRLVTGRITGDLTTAGGKLPNATEGIRLALGGGYRTEFLFVNPDLAYRLALGAGQGGPTLPVEGEYNAKEIFAESLFPLVQGRRGAEDLSVELGYRFSDYSTTGGWPTYKVQASYAPSTDVRVRFGFNRATRSPNVQELFVPQGLGLGGSQDICAGPSPTATSAQCVNLGVPTARYGSILENPAGQYNTLGGGNPDLDPEVADTYSAGVVITPSGLPGLTASFDYYDIRIDDTIANLEADDIMNQCAATGNPVLCNLIHRDSLGTLWLTTDAYTITTNQNVGKLQSRGIDVNAAYTRAIGNSGSFNVNLIGTYLMKQFTNTGLFAYDCLGFYGNQCGIPTPKWRQLSRFSWDTNFNTTFTVGWRMVGPVKNDDLSDNPAIGDPGNVSRLELNKADKIGTFNWFDFATTYRLPRNYTLTAGVNNILDKEPPLGAGSSDVDFGPGFYGTYDYLGRYVFVGLQFNFR